jgi:peptidoglycan hydrolase-like protein with peptidoglycan-binding domain
MEFNGEQIQTGFTTTVYPTETTTYSVLLNNGFGCKYDVVIQSPSAANMCAITKDVRLQEAGDMVNEIQQFLIDQGYPITKTDTFDVRTQTALKLFQLEKVGTVGENVRSLVTGVWDARTRTVVHGMFGCSAAQKGAASSLATQVDTTTTTNSVTPTVVGKVCLEKIIRPGVTNGDVIAIQTFFNAQKITASTLEATGYYGAGTKSAVKTFQEKYADDILKPNDLTSGNGIWGPSAAKKASLLGLCEFVK